MHNMSRRLLVAAAVVLVLVLAALFFFRRPAPTVDLIELFPEAEKRTSMAQLADAFNVIYVTIDGQRKRCIFAHPMSRVIWRIDIPEGAVLETEMALRQEAWTELGDGVLFRIGVSDGTEYKEFVKQVIDPYHVESDRHWFPVSVDLSAYAGQNVQVIFNTETRLSPVRDAAFWGEPRIVVKR
jgi:hypothetical protein